MTTRALWAGTAAILLVLAIVGASACKRKASKEQCDALLDRYATLRVAEQHPGATPDSLRVERDRERSEASGDESFKRCTTEVTDDTLACAMVAPTAVAIERCLD